jgi:putative GTP pyrophosphokinase
MTDQDPLQARATIEAVLSDLEKRRSVFDDFCREVSTHIEKCLRDEQIVIQSVQWRVKHPDKVRAKYADPSKLKKYSRLDDLTDIAGLRVITYYETDVDIVRKLIEREFAIDPEHSEDKRIPDDPEKFTYHAVHLVASITSETLGVRASKQFAGMRGEIQITSILRHAWAEIEHKWYDLKDSFPAKAKRRFARLSALIEMADEEFVSLRNEFEESKKSIGLMVQIGNKEVPIDAQSLRAFIEQESLVGEIDSEIATAVGRDLNGELTDVSIDFTAKLLKKAGLVSVKNLRDALQLHRSEIVKTASELSAADVQRGVCIFHLALAISTVGDMQTIE